MALLAYDPTRMTTVPIEQARVIAYVVDTETGQQYSTVAQAQSAITAKRDEDSTRAGQPVATRPVPRGAVQRGEYEEPKPKPEVKVSQPAQKTIQSTTYQGTGKDRVKIVTYSDGTTETTPAPETPAQKTVTSTTYEGSGANRVKVTKYSDGTVDRTPEPESPKQKNVTGYKFWTNPFNGATYEIPVYSDGTDASSEWAGGAGVPGSFKLYTRPQFTGDTSTTTATVSTTATTVATGITSSQQDIMSAVTDRLNRYGLGALAPLIKKLAIDGATESTIMLKLQDEPLYQERFKANQERIKKGLAVLTPAEYVNVEDTYRQVLRAYGLTQFDNDAYVSQFIANDMSPSELSNRVVTAVQRVRNADPAVSNMLRSYYGIGQNDLVAYVLDPQQQFQKIERQVAASEIGVAAGRQGINIGVPTAEQLAAQGVTQAEAQKGYATIADILPTAQKLTDIYSGMEQGYGLAEAEQEVFNSLASAQRKRQRLAQREIASFSGASGMGRTSLSGTVGGQFQNPERTHRPRQRIRPRVGATPYPRMDVRPTTNYEQKGGTLL